MTTRIEPKELTRGLNVVAAEITRLWVDKAGKSKVNYAAVPYLEAMRSLITLNGTYYNDPATSVVRYFLSNAGTWRGDDARRIKAELEAALAWHAGARA